MEDLSLTYPRGVGRGVSVEHVTRGIFAERIGPANRLLNLGPDLAMEVRRGYVDAWLKSDIIATLTEVLVFPVYGTAGR